MGDAVLRIILFDENELEQRASIPGASRPGEQVSYPPFGFPVPDGKLCGAACDPAPQSFVSETASALVFAIFLKKVLPLSGSQSNGAVAKSSMTGLERELIHAVSTANPPLPHRKLAFESPPILVDNGNRT